MKPPLVQVRSGDTAAMDLLDPLTALIERWRDEAAVLRANGADALAQVKERDADQLEAAWRELQLQEMTLDQAQRACGYSKDHLRRLMRDGELRNVGRKGRPRVLRCDLPQKPGRRSIPLESHVS